MKAKAGDHLVIMGRHVHHPVREGEVLEVRGEDGDPPFVVRWSDTGHATILYPGSDARVVADGHVGTGTHAKA